MTTRINPNDLDRFLGNNATPPPPVPSVGAVPAPAAPSVQSGLADISGTLTQGNNTLTELNNLVGNIVNLWDKIEGVVTKGAERKAERLGQTSVNNYDDIVAGTAVMKTAPSRPGDLYVDPSNSSLPPQTSAPAPTPNPTAVPAPDGGVNIPATEQLAATAAKKRSEDVVEWLLLTLRTLEKHTPDATIKELVASVDSKRDELAANVEPLLR